MKNLLLVILTTLLCSNLVAQTNYTERETTALVSGLVTDVGKSDDIWPGYKISDAPLLAYFNNGMIYAFRFYSSNNNWNPILIEKENLLVASNDFLGITHIPLAPAYPIDNQLAFLFNFNIYEKITSWTFVAFAHERFHRHQLENFKFLDLSQLSYSGHLDDANLALTFLENIELHDYLHTQDLEYLKNFVSVNHFRNKLLSPDSLNWERWQKQFEGTAEYVMIKTFLEYPNLLKDNAWQLFLERTKRLKNFDDGAEKAIKWRHYQTGAIIAFALEKLLVKNWKKLISKNQETLMSILKNHLNLSLKEMTQRYQSLISSSYYMSLEKKATLEKNKYANELKKWENKFRKLSGEELELQVKLSLSGGGSSEKTLYLADGSFLDINSKNFFYDGQGLVTFNYEERQVYRNKNTFLLKTDLKGHKIVINNKEISFDQIPSRQEFSRIKISGTKINLEASTKGVVQKMVNKIKIKLK